MPCPTTSSFHSKTFYSVQHSRGYSISLVVLLAEQLFLFCQKLTCFFFAEYKITHQQASFKSADSVFSHCLLACCFKVITIKQLLE